jgi:hypothetical protein
MPSLRRLEQWHQRLCQGRATDGCRLDTVQARSTREEVAADARAARGVKQVRRRQPAALGRLRMVPREDGSVRHARRRCWRCRRCRRCRLSRLRAAARRIRTAARVRAADRCTADGRTGDGRGERGKGGVAHLGEHEIGLVELRWVVALVRVRVRVRARAGARARVSPGGLGLG